MKNRKRKKILLVDDEVAFTRLIKLNVEDTGLYEVRVVNQGKDALSAAHEFKPDLVLLDLIMPDIDGSQVARWFQDDQSLKEVPIAFLTATVLEENTKAESGSIGSFPFIAKPVECAKLLSRIEKII